MKKLTFLLAMSAAPAVAGAWTMQDTQPLVPTTPASAPASAPAAAGNATAAATAPGTEQLIATVTGVEGVVRVNVSGKEGDWQPATVGMRVGENAEFRTGPRSAVRFVIPPDHTITVDRLTTVKVLQAINDNGVIKTQMGMRYGRTRYDIEAAGREHESSIASPSSTLAVRGTRFSSYDQRPFPAQGVSLTGRVQFRDFKKRVAFGSRGGGKSKVEVNKPNAASVALGESVVDPGARLARTQSEDKLVATLLQSGATLEFDYDKGIRVVRGGQPPRTDAELVPTLPGSLNFVLRWTGPGTDLNMGIFSPGNETLYPIAGLDQTSSGGRTAFDHRGGANGGIEVGFWPANFPLGVYQVASVHISGPNSPATLDAFRDGQRIDILGGDGTTGQTISYIATPVPPEIASAQAVGFVNIRPPDDAQSKPDRLKPAKPPAGFLASPARKTLAPGAAKLPMGPRRPPAVVAKKR